MDTGPPLDFSYLLGRFELRGPDGPIDLNSKKLAALLELLKHQPRASIAVF